MKTSELRKIRALIAEEFRYLALLIILLMLFVVQPAIMGLFLQDLWFDLFLSVTALTVGFALLSQKSRRWIAIGLGIPTVLFSLGSYAFSAPAGDILIIIGHLFGLAFLIAGIGVILVHLLSGTTNTLNKLVGSICGYMLLGLAWALAYSMLDSISPDSFDVSEAITRELETDSRLNVFLYYSFVTLTTLGFGDMTPASAPARVFSWFEAMIGQFYVAILVAGLVSQLAFDLRPNNELRRRS